MISPSQAHEPLVKLQIGISQCLLGDKVRYNGQDKRLSFATDLLKPYADFHAICPETAIGLPTPRPTIGLYQSDQQSIIMRFNDPELNSDIDSKMSQFCQQTLATLPELCGYIVCAKSPSCGLNNANVYHQQQHNLIGLADGRFTASLRQHYPWLPIADNQQLTDPANQAHFIIRLYALQRLNQLKHNGLTRQGLVTFHSRYKLLLLAHSQPLYRQLGPLIAQLAQWYDLNALFIEYRKQLMALLATPASRENHTNVLMHIQGYFNRYLSGPQKQALTATILAYLHSEIPLSEPIASLNAYLTQYPNNYLSQQYYFMHYPTPLPD